MCRLKSLIFLLLAFHFQFSSSWENSEDLLLEINDGKILGRIITSKSGKIVKAFMGIPYAAPPVNELRFEAPQKPQKWEGVKKTQQDGNKCIQIFLSPLNGDEDCLYLNVYVPTINQTKIPVILWIHGGGLVGGDGTYETHNPENIVDHDVILVSGNYRVGPMGFLSSEDSNAPGNFGFKDQVMILQWIQENIEHFGGDKNSVTIWGQSAGGVSVNFLMWSPLARGLFHKAISNSGSIHNSLADPWRRGEALSFTQKIANSLNCSTSNSNLMISCLKDAPADLIVSTANALSVGRTNRAVIEDFTDKEPTFISSRKFPSESVKIPWLLGMNSDEGLMYTERLFNNEIEVNKFIMTWNEALPQALDYNHLDASTQSLITKKITQFYFGTDTLTAGFNMQNLTNLYTDASYLGIIENLKQRFEHSNLENTFVYLFTHKGSSSYSKTDEYQGTSHADDLMYLFPMHKTLYQSSMPTSDDEELSKYMPMIWVDFVKNGSPRPPLPSRSKRALAIPPWPAATSIPFDYLQIGNENGNSIHLFELKKELYVERSNFWMKLREDHKLSRWNGSNFIRASMLLIFVCVIISRLNA